MVIVRLLGGIGNQMFQYAAGRRLAWANKVPIKLHHVSNERVNTPRPYNLHVFNIAAEFATPREVGVLRGADARRNGVSKYRFWRKNPSDRATSRIVEKHFHFDPDILSLPGDVYLEGYWQSEKYFKDAEALIRKELSVKMPTDQSGRDMADLIAAEAAPVSIHVRRGDYVSDVPTSRFHGACSLDYYHDAVERVCGLVAGPRFFVFSDDMGWVKEHLRMQQPVTYVDFNNDEKNYEDLRLMSLCKHHIIANSSFSWWGAWLNPNPAKIVIAPRKWFNDPSIDTADLLPESWIRL